MFHGAGVVLGPWAGDDDAVADWNQQIIDEFRANGGTVETNGFGRGLVLVHHLGAKTGQERVSPVANIRQPDGSRLVAASKGGAPDNPAWYHNLLAHPEVTAEVGHPARAARTMAVRAVEITGPERDELYDRVVAVNPGFADYARKTEGIRTIPLIALDPRPGD